MNPPSQADVARVLQELLAGTLSRQEASEWATPWVSGGTHITDASVWNALELLCAADLVSTDRSFLYEEVDFRECLERL